MNYNFSEITFPSRDGIHTIHAEIYTPKNCEAKGIVQLAHGMIDHVGRYKHLAEYLTGEGYIFAGNHHLGHGRTVSDDADFGFFAESDGVSYVIEDLYTMNRYLRDSFPALPLVMLGHSMGSFLARLYVAQHPNSVKGVIIHGTAGENKLAALGIGIAKAIKLFFGPKHRSGLITSIAFGSYNSRFPKSEGENAWLTRDLATVEGRATDKFTNYIFTVSGYIDLFSMIRDCNSKKWYEDYPKELPTLITSGDMDPVGDYGRGPEEVYKNLLVSGASEVSLKMYEGARHELFNETNRTEVFADLVKWLDGVVK